MVEREREKEKSERASERAMKNWLSAKARSYQHPQSEREGTIRKVRDLEEEEEEE